MVEKPLGEIELANGETVTVTGSYALVGDHMCEILPHEWKRPDADKKFVTIEVRGGMVQRVTGLPPGYSVQIIDHDNREEG